MELDWIHETVNYDSFRNNFFKRVGGWSKETMPYLIYYKHGR